MSRILFSHSYFYPLDEKQWSNSEPYPPLMTITAAAYLRSHGHEVDLFDVALKSSEEGLDERLANFRPDYFVIFDDGFNYLTKMCLTTMREAAFRMQEMAKSMGIKVITCSSDSTDHYEKYLANAADYVIRGEGEVTLLELIRQLDENGAVEGIRNLAYHTEENGIHLSPKGQVLAELDTLPQAAWDLVNIENYRAIWKRKNRPFFLNIATTRGCPYKCNWCAKPIYGNRYNTRSVARVVDEIEMHVKEDRVDHFWMCDDIFGLKPGWVQDFRDELTQRGLKIKFKIQSRADLLLKEDNLTALADAGLHEAWIGAESGSQKILDAMDKGTTVDQIEESTRLLKRLDVRVAFFIQFGYLDEKWEDINQTIRMILKLMPERLGISVSYPLPGTKFYDKVKNDLQLKANWVDSDDLDMMFKNTYSPKFYKILHRYVHNLYHIKLGMRSFWRLITHPTQGTSEKIRNVTLGAYNLLKVLPNQYKLKECKNH